MLPDFIEIKVTTGLTVFVSGHYELHSSQCGPPTPVYSVDRHDVNYMVANCSRYIGHLIYIRMDGVVYLPRFGRPDLSLTAVKHRHQHNTTRVRLLNAILRKPLRARHGHLLVQSNTLSQMSQISQRPFSSQSTGASSYLVDPCP